MEKKTINIKIYCFLLLFAWFLFCLMFSFKTKASSPFPLPYYVDYYKDSYFPTFNTDQLNSVLPSGYDLYWISEPDPNYSDFVFYLYAVAYNDPFVLKNHELNATVNYEDFDFTTDYVVFTSNVYCRRFYINNSGVNAWGNGYTVSNVAVLGRDSTSINSLGYTPNVPFLCNHDFTLNGALIFTNGTPPQPPIGQIHAVPPDFDGNHFFPHGSGVAVYPNNTTQPSTVPPTYTINNYTWTTVNTPPVDTSSVEALIESEITVINYLFGWLSSNLSGEFANLTNNIKGLVDYIGETLQYYGDLIIANIQNGIQNIYENFEALVEPIATTLNEIQSKFNDFVELFTNPFDEEEFEEQIENSSFFTNYNAIIDNCEEISEIFDYAEEREHFSLYISFENPFADSEHKIISSEINFDWLVPLRSVYRPFIWVCVLIELFVGGARVLTRIIGGHGI